MCLYTVAEHQSLLKISVLLQRLGCGLFDRVPFGYALHSHAVFGYRHTRKPVDFQWRNSIEPHVQEAITMAVNAILAYLSTEKCGSACIHDSH